MSSDTFSITYHRDTVYAVQTNGQGSLSPPDMLDTVHADQTNRTKLPTARHAMQTNGQAEFAQKAS